MAPRKQQKPRAKKISLNGKAQWEQILKSVNKEEVPVQFLKSMTVHLLDGTKVQIDVKELIEDGHDPFEIESQINERLETLDDYIKNVDLYICVDSVAEVVGEMTDTILKKI